jgi:hypothetical protein
VVVALVVRERCCYYCHCYYWCLQLFFAGSAVAGTGIAEKLVLHGTGVFAGARARPIAVAVLLLVVGRMLLLLACYCCLLQLLLSLELVLRKACAGNTIADNARAVVLLRCY